MSTPDVQNLSESLIDEMVGAVGLPKTRFMHQLFWHLFGGITDRLAALGGPFDHITAEQGLPAGSAWALSHFCHPASVQGMYHIPAEGPLLVATNHPGAYDGLVLFCALQRQDIQWISSDIRFFRLLPHVRQHILFSSREDSRERMLVLRNAIQHLRQGGALVYFAAGHREPDPAVFPGARASITAWLDAFSAFLKYVPGLKILPSVMSGMITKRWAHHPITWLRRRQIDKQRLAEFGQVISQLLRPGKLMITPKLSFGAPFTKADLRAENDEGRLMAGVIARAQALLYEHMQCSDLSPSPSSAN